MRVYKNKKSKHAWKFANKLFVKMISADQSSNNSKT